MEINAVFEGGGVKGISLAGAVEATERAGRTFKRSLEPPQAQL